MSTITAAQAVKRIKDAIDLKANSSDVYTQSEIDQKINQFAAHYLTDKVDGRFVPFASHARLADAKAHHTKENPRFWYGDDGHEPDKNDYCVVLEDETHDNKTTRYSFVGEWGNDEEGNPKGFFRYQYTVNDTALTDEQWDALNSGITAEKVQKYDEIVVPTKVSELENDSEYVVHKNYIGFVDYVNANAFIGVKQEGDELEFESDTFRTLGNAYKVDLSKYAHADDVYSKGEVDGMIENAGKVKTVNNIEPDENGNIAIEASGSAYKLVDVMPDQNDEYVINNNTISRIVVTDDREYRIILPIKPEGEEVRDFILRIENTTPTNANVTIVNAEGEDVTYESIQDDWAVVESGVNLISFTETKRED